MLVRADKRGIRRCGVPEDQARGSGIGYCVVAGGLGAHLAMGCDAAPAGGAVPFAPDADSAKDEGSGDIYKSHCGTPLSRRWRPAIQGESVTARKGEAGGKDVARGPSSRAMDALGLGQ